MKKLLYFFIMIAVILNAAACRPAAEPEGNVVAAQQTEKKNEPAQTAGSENETGKDEVSAETNSGSNDEALPETSEFESETEESESFKAAKERWEQVKKEYPDRIERYKYCLSNDIKIFYEEEEEDLRKDGFVAGEFIVVLTDRATDPVNKTIPDFPAVNVLKAKNDLLLDYDFMKNQEGKQMYHLCLDISTDIKTKEESIKALREIEKMEEVLRIYPVTVVRTEDD